MAAETPVTVSPFLRSRCRCRAGSAWAAFTLVELLAVLTVLAVLAAMLFPLVETAKRNANRTKCAGNLKALGNIWNTYAADHNGFYPSNGYSDNESFGNWNALYGSVLNELFEGEYADNPDIFFCPEWKFNRYPFFGKEHAIPGGLYYFSYSMYSGQLYAEVFNESLKNNLPPARKQAQGTSRTPLLFDETSRYTAEGWSLVNHYNKTAKKPYGGNVVYADGHVEWRPFSEMIMVMNAGGGSHRRYY